MNTSAAKQLYLTTETLTKFNEAKKKIDKTTDEILEEIQTRTMIILSEVVKKAIGEIPEGQTKDYVMIYQITPSPNNDLHIRVNVATKENPRWVKAGFIRQEMKLDPMEVTLTYIPEP